MDWKKTLSEFKGKDPRALSRMISSAENHDEKMPEVLKDLFRLLGKARVIGITGPPGAGKSSLTNHFVRYIREAGKTVAVIAVDPVSPFSGGALLGDRIRLSDHFNDPGVFIRSLSTRGKLGGLSLATREVVHIADAFGFDYVLIETVGVGQSEIDVRKIADITLVVLVPEWGDSIQALKAGLMEIADFFVVNKSDREGAERLVTELKNVLQMGGKDLVPVLTCSTLDDKTVRTLFSELHRFLDLDAQKKVICERREKRTQETVYELIETYVLSQAQAWVHARVKEGKNPYELVLNFKAENPPQTLFKA